MYVIRTEALRLPETEVKIALCGDLILARASLGMSRLSEMTTAPGALSEVLRENYESDSPTDENS